MGNPSEYELIDVIMATILAEPVVVMLAAIVSALAAFLVGMGLGRRQQAADDRRQWDNGIKTEYMKIIELLKVSGHPPASLRTVLRYRQPPRT